MQSSAQSEPMAHTNGYSSQSASDDRSPSRGLSNLSFLKDLATDKKQTKDGQPPKRRGPKPDSKPALTRRQELNRQAQRTHRERKEMYIKALEAEVLKLKDIFTETTRERDRIRDENERLKALLAQHGISYDIQETPIKFQREHSGRSGYGPSSSGSISGSYRQGSDSTGQSNLSPPPAGQNGLPLAMPNGQMQPNDGTMQSGQLPRNLAQLPSNRLDYDQIGVDFVLTLERPCMEHLQFLVVRSHNSDEQEFHHPAEAPDDRAQDHCSGHVLMATCPSYDHVMKNPNEPAPYGVPDLAMPDLTKLLDLSTRLPLNHDSEITPVMAWTQIYTDPRIVQLTLQDFERIKLELGAKIRCYGFGAVLEEFEVRDAVEGVLAEKITPNEDHDMTLHQVSVIA